MAGRTSTYGGSGGGAGAIPGTWSPEFGGVPRISLPQENLAAIYGLSGINGMNQTAAVNNLKTLIPGLAPRAQGQLPPDVINLIQQQAAERGIGSGTGFRGGDYLKALGLTSLGVSTDAAKELEQGFFHAPQIDPTAISGQIQDARTQQSIYGSAPIPAAAHAAAIGDAQAGIGAGMRTGGGVSYPGSQGGGGGGLRDALGFPIATNWGDAWSTPNPPAVGAINPQTSTASNPYASWNAQYGHLPSITGTSDPYANGTGDPGIDEWWNMLQDSPDSSYLDSIYSDGG